MKGWGLERSQWVVLLAAWLGWGFDVFDGLLFNLVAPNCVPSLLGLPLGSPAAKAAALRWTGIMTAVLLIGWAIGGILFGLLTDRIGRRRTLILTVSIYSLGTMSCAFAPNIWALFLARALASLGIGGEWAAGAAMVAETVPESRRVEAGALLFTASPFGLLLATLTNWWIAGVLWRSVPDVSWRYVFLVGILPAMLAVLTRSFMREPERWRAASRSSPRPRIRELFDPRNRRLAISGLTMSLVALIAYWSCNAFIPIIATTLAQTTGGFGALARPDAAAMMERWKTFAIWYFNLGGAIGSLLTAPIAKRWGRRPMFAIYLLGSGLALFAAFGLEMAPQARLAMYLPVGLAVYGIGGSFSFYLPELFSTRLRGTGSGFCYNSGRILAAAGPFLIGSFVARSGGSLGRSLEVLSWIGFVPICGLLFLPWVVETRDKVLSD